MNNPFVFGSVVKGEHFCNRSKEIKEIGDICKSNNNLILVSPRRYGKTSLVVNALEQNRQTYLLIDCTKLDSKEDFVNRIITKYLDTLKEGNVLERVKYFSKVLDLEFTVKTNGFEIKIRKFEYSGLEQLINEISKTHIIVFDEFQDVFEFDKTLVKRLRGILQHINKTFIFLGSKKHMILHIFEDQNSPFYKFGIIMPLNKLSESEWQKFISSWFIKSKLSLSQEEFEKIISYSNNVPFYVQYISYYVWAGKFVGKSAEKSIFELLEGSRYIYEDLFSKFPPSQRKTLSLVAQRKETIFAQDILAEYSIKTPQLLNKSLKALIDKGILEKNGVYFFVDPLFERFVQSLKK